MREAGRERREERRETRGEGREMIHHRKKCMRESGRKMEEGR